MPEAHSPPLLNSITGMSVGFFGVHHDHTAGFGRIHLQKSWVNPCGLAGLLGEGWKGANGAEPEHQTSIAFHTHLYLSWIHASRHACCLRQCTRYANGEGALLR
jgi:hypothetical protein